jgi:thioredoxin reductase (NADPH)
MKKKTQIFDAIVIGAGPAGLTAGIYLGRFRRQCLVVHDSQSRARWIPTSHNIPGFIAGVGGVELLGKLEQQCRRYGAHFLDASVTQLDLQDDLFAVTTADQKPLYGRYVLLATGVKDHLPDLAGASEAVLRSLVRFCPICDAFEAIDRRIAVIGDGSLGEREAAFLTTYSESVTLLHLGNVEPSRVADLRVQGIDCIPIKLSDLVIEKDRVVLRSAEKKATAFECVYLALGCSPRHSLATGCNAKCDEHGALLVDAHQNTSVPGLYAAGDVVRGLNQVVVAAAEAAIAATDIHNKLRGQK